MSVLISAACQLLLRDELDFVFLKMKNEKTVFETLQFFENTGVASSASSASAAHRSDCVTSALPPTASASASAFSLVPYLPRYPPPPPEGD